MEIFEVELDIGAVGSPRRPDRLREQLRSAILNRQIRPGTRLPSSRGAAARFEMARSTIVEIYNRLADEGLVEFRHGSGTYAALVRPSTSNPRMLPSDGIAGRINPYWLAPDTRAAFGYFSDAAGPGPDPAYPIRYDFRPGMVDLRHFPFDALRRVSAQKMRHFEQAPFNYGHPQGNADLREAISAHLAVMRALPCSATDIVVTTGAQQAFDLLARILVKPGRSVVAVENPGYAPTRIPFAAAGARLHPVAVDEHGMAVENLPRGVDIICVSPSHQFPFGSTLSRDRRQALIRHARENGAVIVEDDYDGEFRALRAPIKALKAADEDDLVFYVGTFSKSTLPNIRIGFVLPPRWATEALTTAKICTDGPNSLTAQAAVSGFIGGGHLTRHVAKMRRLYGERRQLILEVLHRDFTSWLSPIDSAYGMHVTAMSHDALDISSLSTRLGERNVLIRPLGRYYIDAPGKDGLVFGFGMLDTAAIREGLTIIRETIISL